MLPRVIPILGINNTKLVKTVKFKKPNYIGDPLNAIKIFNDKMVDEIAIVDIRASVENREPNYKLIEEMAGECFSPLAYGGGIKNIDQAEQLFAIGVEKLILNSTAFSNPGLIEKIANAYGNQSVVVSLDVKKNLFGKLQLTTLSGTKTVKGDVKQYVEKFQDLGVGEFILNDVTLDGTFKGYNTELLSKVSGLSKVPVVALGGCRGIDNMQEAISSGSSAVAASSYFVYRNNNPESILIHYPAYDILKKQLDLLR